MAPTPEAREAASLLPLLLLLLLPLALGAACPCLDHDLCKPLELPPRKEIFVFSINDTAWQWYDLSLVTTVVAAAYPPSAAMVCALHARGVRVELMTSYPTDQLLLRNETFLMEYLQQQVVAAKVGFYDGVNMDYEDALNSSSAFLLTWMLQTATVIFKRELGPHFRLTFDAPWSPNCIDGRCFDFLGISKTVDLMFIMSYNLRRFGVVHSSCN
jgi:di-N-acetylchitobiase